MKNRIIGWLCMIVVLGIGLISTLDSYIHVNDPTQYLHIDPYVHEQVGRYMDDFLPMDLSGPFSVNSYHYIYDPSGYEWPRFLIALDVSFSSEETYLHELERLSHQNSCVIMGDLNSYLCSSDMLEFIPCKLDDTVHDGRMFPFRYVVYSDKDFCIKYRVAYVADIYDSIDEWILDDLQQIYKNSNEFEGPFE